MTQHLPKWFLTIVSIVLCLSFSSCEKEEVSSRQLIETELKETIDDNNITRIVTFYGDNKFDESGYSWSFDNGFLNLEGTYYNLETVRSYEVEHLVTSLGENANTLKLYFI